MSDDVDETFDDLDEVDEVDDELDDDELDDDELDEVDDELDEVDDELDDEVDDELDDEYEPGDVNTLAGTGYEPGDVNTVVATRGRRAAEVPSATADGQLSVAVLEYIARAMSDDPDAVVIRKEERRGSTVLRLHVAPQDMGRVIGRRGRTAQAIRTLVGVAGAREGVQTAVDIVDD